MAKQFGDRYKDLIKSNPNQKSLPNNDPGIVFANPTFKNPYKDLLHKWDWVKPTVSAPFIGRKTRTELVDLYYVVDGYVEIDYVTVEQGEVIYPLYT
jgi:hypothetical protein